MRSMSTALTFRHHDSVYTCRLAFVGIDWNSTDDVLAVLSERERARYDAMTAARRSAFLLGRSAAKAALADGSRSAYRAIDVDAGVFGFPVVRWPAGAQVSITHTRDWAAALAYPEQHPIGVDLEQIREDHVGIVPFLTALERQWSGDSTGPFVLWSAKESLAKVIRTGFTSPLQLFEVNAMLDRGDHLECCYTNFSQYKTLSFVAQRHVLSICCPRESVLAPDALADLRRCFEMAVTQAT